MYICIMCIICIALIVYTALYMFNAKQSQRLVNKIVVNKKLSQDTARTLYLFMAVSSLYIL